MLSRRFTRSVGGRPWGCAASLGPAAGRPNLFIVHFGTSMEQAWNTRRKSALVNSPKTAACAMTDGIGLARACAWSPSISKSLAGPIWQAFCTVVLSVWISSVSRSTTPATLLPSLKKSETGMRANASGLVIAVNLGISCNATHHICSWSTCLA